MENKEAPRIRTIGERGRGPVILPKLTGDQPAWFALYVQVNHEKEVTKRLEQKTFECFLPLMERWSKRKDRRKRIQVPVFPGYVFVRTVLDNYTSVEVLKTPGAVFFLRNTEGALPVPDYQVENLKAVLTHPESLALHDYLKEGDWVEVVRGPLAGCAGILLRRDPKKGRLVVSVDIIRQAVSVELYVEDVRRIQRPEGNRI